MPEPRLPYQTSLNPADEAEFQRSQRLKGLGNQADWPGSDYDERGQWLAQKKGLDPGGSWAATASLLEQKEDGPHGSDVWKTPYHRGFSNESKYSISGREPGWTSDGKLVSPTGAVVLDESKNEQQTNQDRAMSTLKGPIKPMFAGGQVIPRPWWQQSAPPPMPGTEEDPTQPPAPPQPRFDMPDEPQQAQQGFMPEMPQWQQPQAMASAAPQGMSDEPGTAPAPVPTPVAPPVQQESDPNAMGRDPIRRARMIGALEGADEARAQQPVEDARITAAKANAAALAKKSTEHVPAWRQAVGAALSISPRLRGVGQMVLNPPDKAEELAAELRKDAGEARLEEKAKQDAEMHRITAGSLETQRESLAEQRRMTAESYRMSKETAAKTEERKKAEDALRYRQMGVVQDAAQPVPDGFSAVPLPDEPGKVVVIPPTKTHFVVNKDTAAMAEKLGMGGLREGDVISTDVWKVLATAAGNVARVQAKPEPPAKPQYTGALRAALQAEGADPDADNIDPKVMARALERSKERPPTTGNENARADKSYQFNVGELNKIGKPVADAVQRLGRLQDTLAQNSPQADALIAPELLTVMAGGAGSGLRMNEAEISRVVGGRSNWESLKANINKWQIDPNAARNITPSQQQQIRALVGVVANKLNAKQAAIDEAHQALVGTDDPAEHRKIVNSARQKFTAVDTGGSQPGSGPRIGVVEDGYQFKGGDPSDKANWIKVKGRQ